MYVYTYIREAGIRVEPIVRYVHVKSANSQGEREEREARQRAAKGRREMQQRAESEKTGTASVNTASVERGHRARDSDLSRA